jgi:hypothetical protein
MGELGAQVLYRLAACFRLREIPKNHHCRHKVAGGTFGEFESGIPAFINEHKHVGILGT